MNNKHHHDRVCGPTIGPDWLRTAPPPNPGSRKPSSQPGRPKVTLLGCLSTYDYLCHNLMGQGWKNCQYGGNRD